MTVCKAQGASPITFLSILMSRAIQEVHPENDKPIISNFPMDARNMLGVDKLLKIVQKSSKFTKEELEKLLVEE